MNQALGQAARTGTLSESRLRLFFALWPDPPLRGMLAELAGRHVPDGARRLAAQNLHLTLAFLGSVAEARLPEVLAAAGEIRAAPFTFTLERVSYWSRPRLLCLTGGRGHAPLERLAAALGAGLAERRLPHDAQPFRAHLTLARKLRESVAETRLAPPLTWHATRFCLVASTTHPEGARYTPLADWRLLGRDAPARPAASEPGRR
jgi:2'-5' RNA ligase